MKAWLYSPRFLSDAARRYLTLSQDEKKKEQANQYLAEIKEEELHEIRDILHTQDNISYFELEEMDWVTVALMFEIKMAVDKGRDFKQKI